MGLDGANAADSLGAFQMSVLRGCSHPLVNKTVLAETT